MGGDTERRGRRKKGVPKHEHIRELLRRQIADGVYPPGSRLPPLAKLTRTLNVSSITLRHALSALATEGLIVRQQGSGTYVADRSRALSLPGRKLRIGVFWRNTVLPDRLTGGLEGQVTQGILSELGLAEVQPEWPRPRRRGPNRAIWTSPDRSLVVECISQARTSAVEHPPIKAVREGRFDAAITVCIIEEPWLRQLIGLGIPTVLTDSCSEEFERDADQVFLDPLPGYRAAVKHLVSQGCERIHFFGGLTAVAVPSEDMTYDEIHDYVTAHKRLDPDTYLRMNAYRQGMLESGKRVEEDWIHHTDYGGRRLRELAERLLRLPANERPQGAICHSISQAEALAQTFSEHGLDLMTAGALTGGYGGPALAISADGREMGAKAVALLISRLERPNRPLFRTGVSMLFQPRAEHLLPL